MSIRKNAIEPWVKGKTESPLATFLASVHPISDEIKNFINQHTYPKQVERGDYLLKAGEVCEHVYFIRRGVVRGFVKEGSKEITTWITAENEIVSSIRILKSQESAVENIQAIETCELIVGRYEDLQYLYERSLEMNIVARKLLEHYYCDAEERAFISRIPNAAKRYRYFVETKSNLANRIPLKYIASYLGITIETLSRIRSSGYRVK